MNGTTLISSVTISSATTAWRVMATGDFNSDGKTDIIWQWQENFSPTYEVLCWLMNGVTFTNSLWLTPQ